MKIKKNNKNLYKIAVGFLKKAYESPANNYKSTCWSSFTTIYNKEEIQVLAIPGTNDYKDWFWNILLLQKNGIKYGAYVSVQRILKSFIRKPNMKLLITCHSKSGPTGIYLQEILNAEYCVAFEPVKGFIEEKSNSNTIIFIDSDDIVPKLGWSRFYHRIAYTVYLPKDKKWYNIKGKIQDHMIDHISEFIDNMEE